MRLTKFIAIVFFIVVTILFHFLLNTIAADNVTIRISMLSGEEQTRFNKQALVAGVWHYVNLSGLNQNINQFTFRLYKGYFAPSSTNRNETNYYEWKYDKNNAILWSDISGYGIDYIDIDRCAKNGNVYSFCVGIKDTFPNVVGYYENWTIEVYENGNKLRSEDVVIKKPETGPSVSKPSSIIFNVDPFTKMRVIGDNFFKIGNRGNIPLYVSIDNTKYGIIEITNLNGIILPDETRTLYVNLNSESWPPGVMKMNVQLDGSYPQEYFLDTNATVTLYNSFIIDVPTLQIYVGHSNYKIEEIQDTDITFQYLENINMNEGEIKDLKAYVSGDGPVSLEIWADEENVKLLKLMDGNTEKNSPITFVSTISSERTITMKIEAVSEGKTGTITYRLTTGGVTKTYTTQVKIGPPASQNTESFTMSLSIVQIIVIILVIVVVIYMFLSYLKHKRR